MNTLDGISAMFYNEDPIPEHRFPSVKTLLYMETICFIEG